MKNIFKDIIFASYVSEQRQATFTSARAFEPHCVIENHSQDILMKRDHSLKWIIVTAQATDKFLEKNFVLKFKRVSETSYTEGKHKCKAKIFPSDWNFVFIEDNSN